MRTGWKICTVPYETKTAKAVLFCLLSLLCLFLSDSTPCLSHLQVQTLYYAVPVPALTPGLLRYNVKFNQC